MESFGEKSQMTIEINVPILDIAGQNTGEYTVKKLTKEQFIKRAEKLPDMKVCKKCNNQLPLMDFGNDKRKPDGKNIYCKPCHRSNCKKARAKRKKPCVYQLFFTDGCTYIGSTTQNFPDRLAVHRSKVASKTHSNSVFNQYEPEDITGRVLMFVDDEEELRMNEYVLIKHHKNFYKKRCLNAYMTKGGKDHEDENKTINV